MVRVSLPTDDISICFAFAGTFSVKVPSAFVEVPAVEPFTTTEAPFNGLPLSSVTLPVMVFSCACMVMDIHSNTHNSSKIFFMIVSSCN